jgi:osmoprotectant transport system permease protein
LSVSDFVNELNAFLQYVADNRGALALKSWEHLVLVGISASSAVAIGVPLGIFINRWRAARGVVMSAAGVVQTIPSVALLALLMMPLGLGSQPAITALILYALLPIVVNTHTGLAGINRNVLEAAEGLGFTRRQRLWLVELPLASPVIIAGIRTSATITVGVATLSALIGAGGLGDFIFRGLSTRNYYAITLGVLAASSMALLLGAGIGLIEKFLKRRMHQQ